MQDQNTESPTERQPRTLVIKLPRWPTRLISLLVVGLISFGVAYGVVEWRVDTSIIDCETSVYSSYLDQWESSLDQIPEAPSPPGQYASDAEWDRYDSAFEEYHRDSDRYQAKQIQDERSFISAMRECLGLPAS